MAARDAELPATDAPEALDASAPASEPAPDAASFPDAPRDAVHLFLSGHSLFNLWMPSMLEQIATALERNHHYNIQMGLGSSMEWRLSGTGNEQDRRGDRINFDVLQEIADATTLEGGHKYDTLMLTEAANLISVLRGTDSVGSARRFYDALIQSDPDGRVFLYDSWDAVPDGGDFQAWVSTHRRQYVLWECLASAVNQDPATAANPMRMIPGGLVLAHLIEATLAGGLPGIDGPSAFFEPDLHHLSHLGNYVIALAAYSALYGRSPAGAPHQLHDPWNRPLAPMPDAQTAARLQELAWSFVTSFYAAPPNASRSMPECRELVSPFCGGSGPCQQAIAQSFAGHR